MNTTARGFALAALAAAAVAVLHRESAPRRMVYRSPGQDPVTQVAGGFEVRGRVLHDGAPVSGARVRLMALNPPATGVRVTHPVIRQAESGPDGAFVLAGAPAGPARLAIFADRLAPSITTLEIPRADMDVAIALEAGTALEGRVTSGGAALAGARLAAWLAGHDAHIDRNPLREAVTDGEGRYRMEGLDPGRPLKLVILAEGHRAFEKTLRTPAEAPDPLDLDPGLRILGRVVTTSDVPVVGVEIQGSQGEAYTAETLSDESGQVRLGGLVSRFISIRAFKEGYAPARLDLAVPSDGWTIVLRRNGGLAGRAPQAAWLVVEAAGATYRRGLDSDGTFRWEGLPPGPAEARSTDKSGRVLASRKVEIPEGDVAGGILLAP